MDTGKLCENMFDCLSKAGVPLNDDQKAMIAMYLASWYMFKKIKD